MLSPAPLRPVQTRLLVGSMFLVAGSLYPWSPGLRIVCAGLAIAIVLCVLVSRLRGHTGGPSSPVSDEIQNRVDRIRAERAKRMGPRR